MSESDHQESRVGMAASIKLLRDTKWQLKRESQAEYEQAEEEKKAKEVADTLPPKP